MPVAYIPSPSQGVWHLGPVPIRGYALMIILGVIVSVWVADRRYTRIGGPRGLILDVATWAVPFGLVGARLYSVITDYELYFVKGRDWVNVFKIWDGGIGIPGAIALGAAGAWIACHRAGVKLAPVAGAAAPGIAFAQAIGRWGNWFNQELYGRPSTLPWALRISPEHRVPGFENFATFQPTFFYESVWDVAVGLVVIWAARKFLLTGDRTFALYAALYSIGRFGTESLRIDYAHRILGLRVNQWMMILIFAGSIAYLYRTRRKRGPDVIAAAAASASAEAVEPGSAVDSDSAVSAEADSEAAEADSEAAVAADPSAGVDEPAAEADDGELPGREESPAGEELPAAADADSEPASAEVPAQDASADKPEADDEKVPAAESPHTESSEDTREHPSVGGHV